jgi:malonyl CoA-acyl carrier protein transacylase
MAKQTANDTDKKLNAAVLFTAIMGASIGVLAIYTNQYGDSSFTDALRVIALAGTMVGGVAAGLIHYGGKK